MDFFDQKLDILRNIIEKGPFDIKRATSLLNDLKNTVYDSSFLSLSFSDIPLENQIKFREILEFYSIICIRSRNLEGFHRSMEQLKSIYFHKGSGLPISPRMSLILSLNLAYFLSIEDFIEFNLELSIIESHISKDDPYLNYVRNLFEAISDNSFLRLSSLENSPPSPYFSQFTSDILAGARNMHANTIEKSYPHMTVNQLSEILHFSSPAETRQFILKRKWVITPDERVIFIKTDNSKPNVDIAVQSVKLAVQLSLLG